jgi:hypothetical protein
MKAEPNPFQKSPNLASAQDLGRQTLALFTIGANPSRCYDKTR